MEETSKKELNRLLWKDTILATLFSFMLLGVLSVIVVNVSFFNPLKKVLKDFSFLDVYYAENMNSSDGVDPNIVVINIEHRDRMELGMMLEEVQLQAPKTVGIDIIFRDLKESFSDSILADALKHPNVVTGFILEEDHRITNDPYFQGPQAYGFVNLNYNNDESVVRSFTAAKRSEGQLEYALSSALVKKVLTPEEWEQRNYNEVLVGDVPLNYTGNLDHYLHFGFDEFMMLEDKSILKDKIVLIGYIGDPTGDPYDVEDKLFTPLNPVTAGKSVPDMFGIIIHANAISMLMEGDLLYRVPSVWVWIITFLCTFFLIMWMHRLSKHYPISFRTRKQVVLLFFTIIVTGLSLWLFRHGIILNAVPIIGVTLFSLGYQFYYMHLIKYIKSKRTWKSYV